ncbi:MAG: hypothetical protein AB7P37_02015 [Ramlibacter sp.]
MSIQSTPLSWGASVQGAFFRDMEKKDGASDFTPAAATADAEDGLKVLRNDIATGTREERELAVDILVNLAAGTGDDARKAQDALRSVYANPGCSDASSSTHVRRDIERLAHRLCQLALDPPSTDGKALGSNPQLFNQPDALSLTVAYLGARAPEPPNGNNGGAMKSHIETFMKHRVPAAPVGVQFLGSGRTIDGGELLPAANKLKAFSEKPVLLELYPDTADAQLQQKKFVDPLKALVDGLKASPWNCAAALINVGDPGFQHWMPLVLHQDADKNVQCHVMDSDKTACENHDVHSRLEKSLKEVFGNTDHVHIHKSDMQNKPAGAQACGALSLNLLAAVDRQIQFKEFQAEVQPWEKEASIDCGIDDFDMEGFIKDHMAEWNALDDESQQARMAATRAELLDAWSEIPLPAASPAGSVPVAPQPDVQLAPMPEQVQESVQEQVDIANPLPLGSDPPMDAVVVPPADLPAPPANLPAHPVVSGFGLSRASTGEVHCGIANLQLGLQRLYESEKFGLTDTQRQRKLLHAESAFQGVPGALKQLAKRTRDAREAAKVLEKQLPHEKGRALTNYLLGNGIFTKQMGNVSELLQKIAGLADDVGCADPSRRKKALENLKFAQIGLAQSLQQLMEGADAAHKELQALASDSKLSKGQKAASVAALQSFLVMHAELTAGLAPLQTLEADLATKPGEVAPQLRPLSGASAATQPLTGADKAALEAMKFKFKAGDNAGYESLLNRGNRTMNSAMPQLPSAKKAGLLDRLLRRDPHPSGGPAAAPVDLSADEAAGGIGELAKLDRLLQAMRRGVGRSPSPLFHGNRGANLVSATQCLSMLVGIQMLTAPALAANNMVKAAVADDTGPELQRAAQELSKLPRHVESMEEAIQELENILATPAGPLEVPGPHVHERRVQRKELLADAQALLTQLRQTVDALRKPDSIVSRTQGMMAAMTKSPKEAAKFIKNMVKPSIPAPDAQPASSSAVLAPPPLLSESQKSRNA